MPKNFTHARKWLTLAAHQNNPEARYRLRRLFFQEHSLFKWRYAIAAAAGYGLLIFHSFRAPLSISGVAIGGFVTIIGFITVAFVALMKAMQPKGSKKLDDKEASYMSDLIFSALRREPWRFLLVPAEDGLCLTPLIYVGINPATALVASVLFAALHYPLFPCRYCFPKGVAYFLVALFILPYGIWSVIAAHLLLDVSVFIIMLLRREEQP